ncbi:MAG: DUF6371 domain-containing protein [Roseivirga sp.]
MNSYRYALARYQGPCSRYTCPRCQKPRQFTRYIDIESGQPLSELVGRCNRAVQCGYHYTPQQYRADYQLALPLGQPLPPALPSPPAPAAPHYIDFQLLQQSLKSYEKNHLVTYLSKLFGPEQVKALLSQFYVGTSKRWPGATIFWQVDLEGRVRTGKIMRYDPRSGHRVKQPYNHIDWVHKQLQGPHFQLSQCLFGLHQLRDGSKEKLIGLVESEKTALIASGYCPELIWLGVGSLHQLSLERCKPLRGRRVVLFPDTGGWALWHAKGKKLQQELGSPVQVSDWLEQLVPTRAKQEGLDLADVLVRSRY